MQDLLSLIVIVLASVEVVSASSQFQRDSPVVGSYVHDSPYEVDISMGIDLVEIVLLVESHSRENFGRSFGSHVLSSLSENAQQAAWKTVQPFQSVPQHAIDLESSSAGLSIAAEDQDLRHQVHIQGRRQTHRHPVPSRDSRGLTLTGSMTANISVTTVQIIMPSNVTVLTYIQPRDSSGYFLQSTGIFLHHEPFHKRRPPLRQREGERSHVWGKAVLAL